MEVERGRERVGVDAPELIRDGGEVRGEGRVEEGAEVRVPALSEEGEEGGVGEALDGGQFEFQEVALTVGGNYVLCEYWKVGGIDLGSAYQGFMSTQ